MYRTRHISLGLVDLDVTVTSRLVDPRIRVGIKGGGVNIKLVGIKFHPRLRGVVPVGGVRGLVSGVAGWGG